MSRIRLAAFAATLSCALLLGSAGGAAAQTGPGTQAAPFTKVVAVSGKAANGKRLKGTLTISRFVRSKGKLWAVGRLDGKLGSRAVHRTVRMPATVADQAGAAASQITPTPGACRVLSLVLGPIDLNLLGLRVRTNQINLLIEAVPGAGNLLGNLLCGITGLLDPPALATTPLGQLAQILNALLALAPRTA
jgi:hypothetical protein